MDAYIKLLAAINAGLRDPSRPPSAMFRQYAGGQAQVVAVESVADELHQHRAWRGTPDAPRVLVKSMNLDQQVPEVVLSDCEQESATEPWLEYDVRTGKPVPVQQRKPPPPYEITVRVDKLGKNWVVLHWTLDGSRTCTR